MNKVDGLIQLTRIVTKSSTHKDYDRVVALADKYYRMVTGDGICDLLEQITKRETDDEYEMRKLITNSVIPPTLACTKLPFQKVVRKQPLERKIDWESDTDLENKKSELESFVNTYWGDASLEKYLEYAFVDYNYIDPNAFLITEFDAFDPLVEKANPYPFVATSSQCIDFAIKNNILQYLVVKLPIKFKKADIDVDGSSYTIYLDNDTIKFTQVSDTGVDVIKIETDFYLVEYFEPKAGKVPARRIGYKRDAQTQGRTFVSVFHEIIPYLMKTLKIDSELDLSITHVAFPQRFAYVSPCHAEGCHNGLLPDGHSCGVCHGSGQEPFHSSVMDVITLSLPRDPNDMIDLEKMMVYKGPQIELLTFDKDYLNELRANAFLMMFNKELLSKNEVTATATEKVLEIDNLNDTLSPFAESLSVMWQFVVKDIATFTDLGEGIILSHKYPKDFKFKSLTELMGELAAAKNADASTSTIAAIEDDINELLYADRPEELKIIRIKNSINPFRGYSEENVRLLISQGMTTKANTVLWANLESIFNELEQENAKPWLYDLAYDVILTKVSAKVLEYIERMNGEKPAEPQLNLGDPTQTEEPIQ